MAFFYSTSRQKEEKFFPEVCILGILMAATFLIDEQTLKDIQLRDFRGRTIFDFFDQAITEGGQDYFRDVFYTPLLNIEGIKARQTKIRRLEPVADVEFPFYRVIIKDLEKYIHASHSGASQGLSFLDFLGVRSPIYYYRKRSILEASEFLISSMKFYKEVNKHHPYEDMAEMIDLTEECLTQLYKGKVFNTDKLKVNIFNIDSLDRLIRYELATKLKKLIRFFFEVDAYLAVAKISKSLGFCYPEVFPKNEIGEISMEGVYHIFHKAPVKNNVTLSNKKKIWFLTGANMAGKSSIIKTISSALYLTHIGFPVPADGIKTDLIDGVFTSINLQDNLELGYSHFYVEAIRLKEIVDQLPVDSNALIILDELFKGTNHSDASHAILDVMRNLAQVDGPYVIVSSHITELSQQLKDIPNIDFMRMKIEGDENGLPVFTYKIAPGIAEEKLGMWLLKQSGVFTSIDRLKGDSTK